MININVLGNVGREPEAKFIGDGDKKVVKFSVAMQNYFAKNEEDRTMWLDVEAWGKVGDRVLKIVRKGRQVYLVGTLIISTYPKDVNGVTVKLTRNVIKLQDFQVCGPKPETADETPSVDSSDETPFRTDDAEEFSESLVAEVPPKSRKRSAA